MSEEKGAGRVEVTLTGRAQPKSVILWYAGAANRYRRLVAPRERSRPGKTPESCAKAVRPGNLFGSRSALDTASPETENTGGLDW
jgi:hypothetical protein